ncbi:hypothetical protein EAO76_23755 [Streptomyces sp. sk2.1]|nr:hypothetical protein EAO76_23755 [Streptomyces sp. sk2.1]
MTAAPTGTARRGRAGRRRGTAGRRPAPEAHSDRGLGVPPTGRRTRTGSWACRPPDTGDTR